VWIAGLPPGPELLDQRVGRRRCRLQRPSAGVFEAGGTAVAFGQRHHPQTRPVGLLDDRVGGQNRLDRRHGVRTDGGRPLLEAVWVPIGQSVEMPGRHVFGHGGVPAANTCEADMAGHAVGAGEDLHGARGHPHIQTLSDQRRGY